MYNPRFPHTLVIKRALRDADGEVVFDEEGNPKYEPITFHKVVTFDGDPCFNADGTMETEEVTELEFGYRTSTKNIRERGNVVVADYKLACPMFLDELFYDDVVMLKDYDGERQVALVKKTTFNWGSTVWVNDVQN